MLKRYRELGGEIITIGADGHKPEYIAYDFGKVNDVLKACGFKYYTEFEERKPIFKQLNISKHACSPVEI
ncbi:histidinol-phosphatase [Dorea longicatena]|nr:histidinol-phosphatase [Dorea longicatena]